MNKFHAQKKETEDGIFDSKKEYQFFCNLEVLKKSAQKEHKVVRVERQVRYDMIVNGINCGYYKLDFLVEYADGKIRYYDIKGLKKGSAYSIFRLKKKIVEAIHGILIEEV